MRQLRKMISLALTLALVVCLLASCTQKPDKLTARADEILSEKPYWVEMKVEYDSDDADMLSAIYGMPATTMKVNVDGDKFTAKLALGETGENYISYTYLNGVLYTVWSENGVQTHNQEVFDSQKKAELVSSLGAGAGVEYDDFDTVEVESKGKVSIITCTQIKAEPLGALISSLEEQLKAVFEEATVGLYDATLQIEIDDDHYNVIILTCQYFITLPGDVSYSIDMTYSMKFHYEKELEIVAPSID